MAVCYNFAPMQRHVSVLKRVILWFRRLPYRRGYGIHSPWAFSFVTGVIYERGEFYAYEALRRQRGSDATSEKDDRLLLRLANAFQPSRAIVWGGESVGEPLRYMKAGRSACEYRHLHPGDGGQMEYVLKEWGSVDMLYVDDASAWRDVVEAALPYVHAHTCVIIRNVGGADGGVWQEVIADSRVRLSFDLYYLGILCFDPRFAKQDYVINYV